MEIYSHFWREALAFQSPGAVQKFPSSKSAAGDFPTAPILKKH